MRVSHHIGHYGSTVLLGIAALTLTVADPPAAHAVSISDVALNCGDPPPPPPPPPTFLDVDLGLTFEEIRAQIRLTQSLAVAKGNCPKVEIYSEITGRITLDDVRDRRLGFNEWDPKIAVGILATTQFPDAHWTLSGGPYVEAYLSEWNRDRRPNAGAELKVQRDIGIFNLSMQGNGVYRTGHGQNDYSGRARFDMTITGYIGIKFSPDDALLLNESRYDLTFENLYLVFDSCVPEPGAWAMMIAGFGLTGGAMRRQRHKIALV